MYDNFKHKMNTANTRTTKNYFNFALFKYVYIIISRKKLNCT